MEELLKHLEELKSKTTPDEWTAFLVKNELFNRHLSSVRSVEGYAIALDLTQEDAAFIAEFHNAFPALASEVRRLTAALSELLRVDEEWHGSVNSEMSQARANARKALGQ